MNIPNILSTIRLLLVPVFCCAFFSDAENAHVIAGIIFLTASATDMVDGYLARKLNQITRLGRILDPLADKLMTAAALVSLAIADMIPVWIVIVFLSKEVLMVAGGVVLWGRISDMPASNIVGKTATLMFFVSVVIMMVFNIPPVVSTIMLSVATGFTVLAFVTYLQGFCRLVSKNKTANS